MRTKPDSAPKLERLTLTDADVWRLYADEGCNPAEISAAAGVSLKRAWAWINSIRRERYRGRQDQIPSPQPQESTP